MVVFFWDWNLGIGSKDYVCGVKIGFRFKNEFCVVFVGVVVIDLLDVCFVVIGKS